MVIDLPGHGESVKDLNEPVLDAFKQAVSDVISDQNIKDLASQSLIIMGAFHSSSIKIKTV